MKRLAGLLVLLMLGEPAAVGQSARAPQPSVPTLSGAAPASSGPGAVGSANPEFLKAADEVLAQMSQMLDLPIKQPLKKSLRSKQEIRAYLIREEKDDKDDAQRYADAKSLEAFGLIPKNFPLDSFLINLLTDQVAGLYDPKGKEFYIADWIPPNEQREVMAHELTHALEDQSFDVDRWIKAARPNDDAETARDAVSEGSALAAMVDYVLREDHTSVRELPDVTELIRSGAVEQMSQDPLLSKAPLFIRDSLLFPYLAGTAFSQEFLKAHAGWQDLRLVFEDPPVSTQQILHPDLYLKGVVPVRVVLPVWKGLIPADWKLLEENVMGEFGLEELLKQFLGPAQAHALSPAWAGDRYAVFEDAKTGSTPLVFCLVLDKPEDAARFFAAYSEALEKQYPEHQTFSQSSGLLEFDTPEGGVFLRCVESQCLAVERATRGTYQAINRAMAWPEAPKIPCVPPQPQAFERMAPAAPPAETGAASAGH